MSGTKRVPISRRQTSPITPEALEIYRSIRSLRCTCRRPQGDEMEIIGDEECASCVKWWRGQSRIHHLLHVRPWLWPCLPKLPTMKWRNPDTDEMLPYTTEPHQYELERRFEEMLAADWTTVRARRKAAKAEQAEAEAQRRLLDPPLLDGSHER